MSPLCAQRGTWGPEMSRDFPEVTWGARLPDHQMWDPLCSVRLSVAGQYDSMQNIAFAC